MPDNTFKRVELSTSTMFGYSVVATKHGVNESNVIIAQSHDWQTICIVYNALADQADHREVTPEARNKRFDELETVK